MNDSVNGPGVFYIELHDSNDETFEMVIIAMSLYEAMQEAVELHNDGYVADVCTLDDITSAKSLTGEMLFFSKPAIDWVSENYNLAKRSQADG